MFAKSVVPWLERILEKLEREQHNLLRAADAIPADLWKTCPRQGAWSAAEIIAHIMTVERTVVVAAGRILGNPPKHTPLFKRFRLPFPFPDLRYFPHTTPLPPHYT